MRPPLLITPNQTLGRKFVISFIVVTAVFEFVVKLVVVIDTLRFERLLTTLPTVVLLFFLWRGSRIAWGIAVVCVAATFGYFVGEAGTNPWFSVALAMLVCQLTLLAVPPTRDFLAFQREKNA
jgi:hypothetical protein